MNFAFFCGCLEPGKDGVGDYTRKLALELTKAGHTVCITALNDRFWKKSSFDTFSETIEGISILRISHLEKRQIVLTTVLTQLEDFLPDCCSLQYVPYAFHSQGLPFSLIAILKKIAHISPWHIMVHEAHITRPQGLKNAVVMMGQKVALRRIHRTLQPLVVHTSIREYQARLHRLKIPSKILGLFGNIDILSKYTPPSDRAPWQGVYFGATPEDDTVQDFESSIAQCCDSSAEVLEIKFCGRSGTRGEQFIEQLKQNQKAKQCRFFNVGELAEHDLSKLFFQSHFGIARVKPEYIGKSGSAIAMLEHGLPLWIPLALTQLDINVHVEYGKDRCYTDLKELLVNRRRTIPKSQLPIIAEKFKRDIQIALAKSGSS